MGLGNNSHTYVQNVSSCAGISVVAPAPAGGPEDMGNNDWPGAVGPGGAGDGKVRSRAK